MFIMSSRLPSQWLGQAAVSANVAYEEGNLLDRSIYSLLILLAVAILMSRSLQWRDLFARNIALTLVLAYTLLSITWSDFLFISFKRWLRDLGNYLMVIVVLSEPRPAEAVHALLRRLCYLLIPLSVVLIKYYPDLGRGYDSWTGTAFYMGATTTKNMLGALCLVSGIFLFWDTVRRWSSRTARRTRHIIIVNVAFIGMTLWLLNLSASATSRICLVLGCLVIALAHGRSVTRSPTLLKLVIPMCLCLYLVLDFSFGVSDLVAYAVGRDPTFTGRSVLWNDLLSLNTNPLVGTGYESFWLGDRLELIWLRHPFRPNQAHNGYLEVYLNLGLIGLFVLGGFLIASYLSICSGLAHPAGLASLGLALWSILIAYNGTEAAFKGHLVWLAFMLSAITVRSRTENPRPSRVKEYLIKVPPDFLW